MNQEIEDLLKSGGSVRAILTNHAIERIFRRSSYLDLLLGDYATYDKKQRIVVCLPLNRKFVKPGQDGAIKINWNPFGEFVIKKNRSDKEWCVVTYLGVPRNRDRKLVYQARRLWVIALE